MKKSAICELSDLLVQSGLRLRIGLTDQGHMPTVEKMLEEGKSWDEIGRAIGWGSEAAQKWYGWEKEKQTEAHSTEPP